ncbi:GNAT family N-acetyltransferase [Corallococcus macrosporus]|uniref:Acetyltransferase n=1 Tax=Corallococcus macrosporus DSM 14697 TaxID=1189310 RepID=A0A250JM82_9BACT|nr:GNAT family N-acetyltransferase [Corallococcus macrosporus]ATB44778.1 acetyltransferase [Corallococcus macrosporus DSM 14697]
MARRAMLPGTVSIDLRAATASDEPFLFALYASTRQAELAAWGWAPAQRDAFLRMQWMAQSHDWAARHPRADHQVVCLQGQPVGRLLLAKDAAEWRVVDIALLPEHQGGGVGTRLLTQVRDEAAKAGVPLRLRVLRTNPARRLYERLGFQVDAAPPEEAAAPYVSMTWTPAPRQG